MEQGGTIRNNTVEGNTRTSTVKVRSVCFTLNNYTEDEYKSILDYCKNGEYVIGKEIGEEKKVPHLQGYVRFRNPVSFNNLKAINNRWHIEKARGTMEHNFLYCSKDNNYVTNIFKYKKLSDPMLNLEFKEWQNEIKQIVENKVDDRKIYWYYDHEGNKGKTTFAKHLCIKYKALYVSGKANDVKFGIYEKIKAGEEIKIVVWDIPRTLEDYVSYDAIESVKNGIFYNTKYESGMCIFDIPHIIIFSNFIPDTSMMSRDRWVVREII